MLEISISENSDYQINVTSGDSPYVDLVAEIFTIADGEPDEAIAYSDDANGNTDPEITTTLLSGNYLLLITGYMHGEFSDFNVTIEQSNTFVYETPAIEFGAESLFAGIDNSRARIPFQIPESGIYDFVFASTTTHDLVAEIYNESGDVLWARDDDSGGDSNPFISVDLDSGSYFIEVSSYYDSDPIEAFNLTVSQYQAL